VKSIGAVKTGVGLCANHVSNLDLAVAYPGVLPSSGQNARIITLQGKLKTFSNSAHMNDDFSLNWQPIMTATQLGMGFLPLVERGIALDQSDTSKMKQTEIILRAALNDYDDLVHTPPPCFDVNWATETLSGHQRQSAYDVCNNLVPQEWVLTYDWWKANPTKFLPDALKYAADSFSAELQNCDACHGPVYTYNAHADMPPCFRW